ncbi:25274_t:CDS:2 [Dentiscutata erythropus]|uniref:25274_t:CDS:1 n=1 Tax=Dentiscutata erythropus TaxID=1348616 RepID=A0A9N9P9S5_9GLOM|nr:25274_t:CDS:2 [Dentiscutata erythropus]
MVVQEIDTYREVNNAQISTEDKLDNHQIVEIVLAEQLEYEQGDLDDSDKEPPNILASEGLNELKNFILQKPITDFFGRTGTQNNEYFPNKEYFLGKENFLDDNSLYYDDFYDKDPNNEDLYEEDLYNKDLYNRDLYNKDLYNKNDLYDKDDEMD